MIRKVLSIVMLVAGILGAMAQTPLPLNPKVKHGVLPNGLSYYIMHNEEPKERANFYIAQKVGSTLETQDQLGLAHFLEHMAFNGTSHYPGKNMLNYLQSKGIRFGADINAYTGFDETVYRIDNVPTTDKLLMDSVLLVLHDWSCDLLLEEAEIDAERGVIQEEWRQRNDANIRMYISILPQIYKEYQYQQMPIGKMDVVMNFKPETLRAYYKKWYRPDQQGIVIVGDFNADEMENKVKALFGEIKMPENAAPREYPVVSDNEEPIYASYSDPEMRVSRVTVSFKSEKLPFEMRNTQEAFIMDDLMKEIISMLVNNRLTEAEHQPGCEFAGAAFYFSDFYVSKTKDATNVVIVPKADTQKAVAQVMGIVARAMKTGFTDTEYDRVKEELLSQYENSYNERDKKKNSGYGNELCRHFIDNTPNPGIEVTYELVKAVLPSIPVQAINQVCTQILTDQNMVVVETIPQKDGVEFVGKEELLKNITDTMHAEYEAYVDEVITEPLIAKLPKPGKIKKVTTNKVLGAEEFILSNGIKVVVKSTDFAADEIKLYAFREGGKRTYSTKDAANIALIDDAFSASKMGPFDRNTLRKFLAGKQVGIEFSIGTYTDVIQGQSTVKDLKTMMEMLYTMFTNLNPDQTTYDVMVEQMRVSLANADKNPRKVFFDKVYETRYPNNPLLHNATLATVEAANYAEMFNMLKEALSNAGEYTFVFTGNIDVATFRPLLEQYVATLPAKKAKAHKVLSNVDPVTGDVKNYFTFKMQTPSTWVYDVYGDTNIPYSIKNDYLVALMGDVLDNIYTETLREEEGGTYGASVGANLNPFNGQWQLVYFFQTNKDKQQTLIDRAQAELDKLLQEGTNEEQFNKVKQAALKQLDIQERTNNYWQSNMVSVLRGVDTLTGEREALESIQLSDLNNFMKTLWNGKNRMQVIMEGVGE